MIAGIPGRTWAAPIPAFPEVPRSDASAEARTTERLSRDDVKGVRGTLRLNDGWQIVKRAGLAALPLAMHTGRLSTLWAGWVRGDYFLYPWGNWNGGFPRWVVTGPNG